MVADESIDYKETTFIICMYSFVICGVVIGVVLSL